MADLYDTSPLTWSERQAALLSGWRPRVVGALLACVMSAAAGAAPPDNGEYCLFRPTGTSDTLIVRQQPDGRLMFGLSLWNSRGHNFSAAGIATRIQPGFWILPDPDTLCVVSIQQMPGGTYKVVSVDAPKCAMGQPMPPSDVEMFTTASRLGDAPAAFKRPEDIMRIGCPPRKP